MNASRNKEVEPIFEQIIEENEERIHRGSIQELKNRKMDSATRSRIMRTIGAMLLLFAAVILIVFLVMNSSRFQHWYSKYDETLISIETKVAAIDYKYVLLLIIFGLFFIKSFVPVITVPAIFMLTGMVFPTSTALLVNITGLVMMFTIRYKLGRNKGGGNTAWLIDKVSVKSEGIKDFILHTGSGNPWLLVALRLLPCFPINNVSQLYGSMNFNYRKFLILSLAGMSLKIFSYTFIGHNVYHPLSGSFVIPIIIMLTISGVSILILDAVIDYFEEA